MSPHFPFDPPHTENPAPGRRRSESHERLDDDGAPPATAPRGPKVSVAARARISERDPRDTAAGCRNHAEADLLKAATLATFNERMRMETSAASWTARAEMLGRIEAKISARSAVDPSLAPDLPTDLPR